MSKNNTSVVSNISWKFAERITAQVVTFVVSIILARVLDPSHYGIISMVTIFITIANVFVSDGFGSALIQKKNADATDFCSVLYFNIAFSLLLYFILFLVAPFIAAFFGEGYEILSPVLRVLGLRIILTGVNSVQQAYVAKRMIFKKFFWATLFGTVLSAAVGIFMAYSGYGVWALVAQYLTNTTVDTIVLSISLRKKPRICFSFQRLKGLIQYGWKLLCAKLLITGYTELRSVIIGKLYSSSDLAFYDKGKRFPSLVVTNIDTSIGAVLFPKMSTHQDNIEDLKKTCRTSIRFCSYLLSPLMFGLAAVADTFISVLLTEKWLSCVPFLQLFCIIYLFQPIHTANLQAIKALGRSDVSLKLEIIKKALELISLIAVMRISVMAITINMAVMTTLFIFINAFPNRRLLNYSVKEQLMDIVPPMIMSGVMTIPIFLLRYININKIVLLIIQCVVGATVYILLSIIIKNEQFLYIKKLLVNKLRKILKKKN